MAKKVTTIPATKAVFTATPIAEQIKAAFGSNMYFVEPEKAYGGYLSAVLRNGVEKLRRKTARVSTRIADFSDYDVIFVGFPVWYGTMPDFMQEYIKKMRHYRENNNPVCHSRSKRKGIFPCSGKAVI